MKLINQFFRYFYSTEVIDSRSQLKEDFGDFPPKPLGGDRLTGNFTIVRVRGIGEHIHNTVMMRRIVEGGADRDSISSTMRNELAIDLDNLKFLGELTGIRKKLILWFALGGIFLASLLNFIRLTPKGMNALGFFAPIRRDEYEIVIKVRRVAKAGLDAASMISHEHIHQLQHKEEKNIVTSQNVIWPDNQLFTEKARAHSLLPHLKYVLKKNEVEARLHELVVSFYRVHKNLPLTSIGFLGLLAGNKEMGSLVSETLTDADVDFGPVLAEFVERDKMQARDLHMVLLSMPDDVMLKFIAEVLPVMYGNLLNYYGDEDASRKFLAQISRPNFYDELYVVSSIAPAKRETLSSV